MRNNYIVQCQFHVMIVEHISTNSKATCSDTLSMLQEPVNTDAPLCIYDASECQGK